MLERWRAVALAAVVLQIPFELRFTLFGLSNLKWTFIALVLISMPVILRNWRELASDRLVQAAALFVAIQWIAAAYAPDFHINAFKAATRFSAGLLLLALARLSDRPESISRTWIIASGIAAAYALLSYAGFGSRWPFRTEEFYIGQIQRLSGSFEYPNTAAAYFAMSLPIVWWSSVRRVLKWTIAFLLWCSIVLTLSKGALVAVPLVVLCAAFFSGSRLARLRTAAELVAIGVAAYIVLLPLNPYLAERINGPSVQNPIAAEYQTPWNYIQQQPEAKDQILLHIRNTGITKWRSEGLQSIGVSYRWWNMETEKFLKIRPLITKLPRDVGRDETVEVPTAFQTPSEPGTYVLVVELFGHDLDWFSQTGVKPALIQADIQPGIAKSVGHTDLSALYRKGQTVGSLTASVPRSSLWRAAAKMFLDHPFGVGPDNFRLEYGKYLGASRWDTHIYSNNLYLELLTGSGLVGLAAFGFLMSSIRWRLDPPCLAVAIFLIHGLVDVFLMTTPIYFGFWLLLGMREEVTMRSPATPPVWSGREGF